jgi:hypothetical protein
MFELGQALNAGQSPSMDITSDPTDNVSSESGRWIEYLMMALLSMFWSNLGFDTFNRESCLLKSASSRANEIACSGRLNGSQINSPSGREGTNGGRFKSSGLTVEVQDEWIAMMRRQEPAIVSPRSG